MKVNNPSRVMIPQYITDTLCRMAGFRPLAMINVTENDVSRGRYSGQKMGDGILVGGFTDPQTNLSYNVTAHERLF